MLGCGIAEQDCRKLCVEVLDIHAPRGRLCSRVWGAEYRMVARLTFSGQGAQQLSDACNTFSGIRLSLFCTHLGCLAQRTSSIRSASNKKCHLQTHALNLTLRLPELTRAKQIVNNPHHPWDRDPKPLTPNPEP